MYAIEEFEHAGFQVKIYQDKDCQDGPREWENLGTMVCWHRRSRLGDEQPKIEPLDWWRNKADEFLDKNATRQRRECMEERHNAALDWAYGRAGWEGRIQNLVQARRGKAWWDNAVCLPLYVYEHGGMVMNTGGYSCPWDSGQVGWIYVEHSKLVTEYGLDVPLAEACEKAKACLEAEVETYSQWLAGEVYGYKIMDGKNEVDSCWGFYGMDAVTQAAKDAAESERKRQDAQALEALRQAAECGVAI